MVWHSGWVTIPGFKRRSHDAHTPRVKTPQTQQKEPKTLQFNPTDNGHSYRGL